MSSYEDAMRIYEDYLNRSRDVLTGAETRGRGDIEQYLRQALGYEAPYRAAGEEALGDYQATLGEKGGAGYQSSVDKFRATPGYKYALQTGLQSIQRANAARGVGGSGAEMRELQRTGQGMADQEYGRYQDRLAGLAGMGQQSSARAGEMTYGTGGELAQLGMGTAGTLAQLYGQAGQAGAEAKLAEALQRSRERQSFWGGLGQLAGAGASILSWL